MTVQVPKTGFIELDQGQLFWKYDSPVYDKDRVKSGPSPRPVLLFIHAYVLFFGLHILCVGPSFGARNVSWDCLPCRYDPRLNRPVVIDSSNHENAI